MTQLEIARLDEEGVIIAVESVTDVDYRTDAVSRTVRLEPNNDMRNRLKSYRWNWHKHQFEPRSAEPLDVAEHDTSELVESLIETVEDLAEYAAAADAHAENPLLPRKKFKLSRRAKRSIKEWRRKRPRKKQPPAEDDE